MARDIPDTYTAEVTLISDAERSGIIETSGSTLTIVDPSATTTIVDTISSPVVIQRVLEALTPELRQKLIDSAKFDSEFAPTSVEEMNAALRRFVSHDLVIRNSGRSYVIWIEFSSPDPILAARIANMVTTAYLHYRTELKQEVYSQLLQEIEDELTSLKSELQAADRTAHAVREEMRLVARRFEVLTGVQQEAAIDESASLFARQREAEREAEAIAAVYERLLLNERELKSRQAGPDLNVQLFARAVEPTRPSGFDVKPVIMMLGVLGGLILGMMLGMVMDSARNLRPR